MPTPYTSSFFDCAGANAAPSAKIIVPQLVELFAPGSVVDVGCATGEWLTVFAENGVKNIFGVDGDYVQSDQLKIPSDRFLAMDLSNPQAVPGAPYDMAVSFEVAEHLAPQVAERFVAFLTSLAPVVAFSAAVPFQKGTHHVNEQWPPYWAQLFRQHDYAVIDCLRARLWNDPAVAFYYAQNLLVYASRQYLSSRPDLTPLADWNARPMSLVHPVLYLGRQDWEAPAAAKVAEGFLGLLINRVQHKLKRVLRI